MRIDRKKMTCAMIDADLNTKQLAEKIGLARATVSSVKNGRSCADETAVKIAAGLNVPLEQLMERGYYSNLSKSVLDEIHTKGC